MTNRLVKQQVTENAKSRAKNTPTSEKTIWTWKVVHTHTVDLMLLSPVCNSYKVRPMPFIDMNKTEIVSLL